MSDQDACAAAPRRLDPRRVAIAGTGAYLPHRVLTNADLEKMVETSNEWIVTRTGIRERHIAREDEAASDMAAPAARQALERAGLAPSDVQMIVVATITPDMVFPNTACFVQNLIGARNAYCLDVSAACSGFLYAMDLARSHVACGAVDSALVIGAEKLSAITDWEDRSTCVLFGDGAGAAVLRPASTGHRGILSSYMGSDGSLANLLHIPGGGSRNPTSRDTIHQRLHYIKMTGNEVFKHAVRCMCDAGQRALQLAGLTMDDVALVVPHQANMRIIQAIASRLGNCADKFFVNLDRVGNLSAASVPVGLDEAATSGRLKKGDIVLSVVFGGGFTWGASVFEW
jgi:3-oxoacyl-[acyl-carrier-protein] synthase-3